MSTSLTLALAKLLGEMTEVEALAAGVPISVAIVDDEAICIYHASMDGVLPVSRELAVAKAETAAGLRMTTAELGKVSQPGAELYGIQHASPGRIVVFGGGFPLKRGGKVVGAIGVSGGTVDEDVRITAPVVDAYAEMERYAAALAPALRQVRVGVAGLTRLAPALRATLSRQQPPLPAHEQSVLEGAVLIGLALSPQTPESI